MMYSSTNETIKAFCQQEKNGYVKKDFLPLIDNKHTSKASKYTPIDAECRKLMIGWCVNLVQYLNMDQELVEIAMSYVDRFLLTPQQSDKSSALLNRDIYQLLCMTCLYTAIKVHAPVAISPNFIQLVSQGTYTAKQVEQMELVILQALQFRMNPPTSMSFVRNLLDSTELDEKNKTTLCILARNQVQTALLDHSLIHVPASQIAFCALINALDTMEQLDDEVCESIETAWATCLGLENNTDMIQIQDTLEHDVFNKFSESSQQTTSTADSDSSDKCQQDLVQQSPRSSIVLVKS